MSFVTVQLSPQATKGRPATSDEFALLGIKEIIGKHKGEYIAPVLHQSWGILWRATMIRRSNFWNRQYERKVERDLMLKSIDCDAWGIF
jgi:hypothetical protein